MVEHHIQKEILYTLVTNPSARFAELKPPGMDGNIFTYHLKQLIAQKYVVKDKDGSYGLTSLGKAVGININLSAKELLEQAHSVFLIIVRDKEGRWLLRRRLAHPMYGKWGFIHGEPSAYESLKESANKDLKRRTGLTAASYRPVGGGYVKIVKGQELESFVHYLLIEAEGITGKLVPENNHGQNKWLKQPDFDGKDMIPSMAPMVQALAKKEFQFLELEYNISD